MTPEEIQLRRSLVALPYLARQRGETPGPWRGALVSREAQEVILLEPNLETFAVGELEFASVHIQRGVVLYLTRESHAMVTHLYSVMAMELQDMGAPAPIPLTPGHLAAAVTVTGCNTLGIVTVGIGGVRLGIPPWCLDLTIDYISRIDPENVTRLIASFCDVGRILRVTRISQRMRMDWDSTARGWLDSGGYIDVRITAPTGREMGQRLFETNWGLIEQSTDVGCEVLPDHERISDGLVTLRSAYPRLNNDVPIPRRGVYRVRVGRTPHMADLPIENARATEGRGQTFAVMHNEVRRLSDEERAYFESAIATVAISQQQVEERLGETMVDLIRQFPQAATTRGLVLSRTGTYIPEDTADYAAYMAILMNAPGNLMDDGSVIQIPQEMYDRAADEHQGRMNALNAALIPPPPLPPPVEMPRIRAAPAAWRRLDEYPNRPTPGDTPATATAGQPGHIRLQDMEEDETIQIHVRGHYMENRRVFEFRRVAFDGPVEVPVPVAREGMRAINRWLRESYDNLPETTEHEWEHNSTEDDDDDEIELSRINLGAYTDEIRDIVEPQF